MFMAGSSLMVHVIKNIKSAMLSSLAPISLVVFVFLAIHPSVMSVRPADIYNT